MLCVYLNKLSSAQGHTLDYSSKNQVQCSMLCIGFRDRGGLVFSSKVAVLICDVVIVFFTIFSFGSFDE